MDQSSESNPHTPQQTDPTTATVGSTPIDSYLITGPANLTEPLDTIVKSFRINK